MAGKIHSEGRAFLRAFRALGRISVRQNKLEYLMKPKFHVSQLVLILLWKPVGSTKMNPSIMGSVLVQV